ncbi:MAG: arginine--tRNA ligase [Gammaproteobacteria bacterium]
MKQQLIAALEDAVARVISDGVGHGDDITIPAIRLEVPRNPDHGDYSANIAMLLAKPLRKAPREIASQLLDHLGSPGFIENTEIAGPGFINFKLTGAAATQVLDLIEDAGEAYGKSQSLKDQRVLIEFVSANPTGPLHVGHGRGAAYGDAIASLLSSVGCEVEKEYYVNDAGRQMDILTLSVWIRYLQKYQRDVELPPNGYQGEYIIDIAERLADQKADTLLPETEVTIDVSAGEQEQEAVLDKSIEICRQSLGGNYSDVAKFVCDAVLVGIKNDLREFKVNFSNWFSENSLVASGELGKAIERLEKDEKIFVDDGAKWFRSTAYGDEKDRVVVRDNGLSTYFASDIAYHAEKASRGFDKLINIWGADHHGYIARVRAAMTALGIGDERLEIILVQFAALFRNGEKVPMSTRSGEFVTLRELTDEVGSDAARFFYLSRRADQHLDFDLDLAKSKSNENPVYYVQYAHARICSVFEQLREKGFADERASSDIAANYLTEDKEKSLLTTLGRFPELILTAATNREPHLLTNYLRELAGEFHGYYNGTKILVDESELRSSRLALIAAVRQVLNNGLVMLSISTPTKM